VLVGASLLARARLHAETPAEAGAEAEAAFRTVRDVTYVERTDGAQTADLYLPIGQGPFPGVLMVHGGAWMAGNKNHSAWHARQLAERGFAVMAINYRLAPQHPFPAQLEDCRAALRWMVRQGAQQTHPWDVQRLGAYGYSAGGHLVCLLGMVQAAEAVTLRAVVAGGAPCDFSEVPPNSQRLAYWLGGTREQRPAVYREASPTSYVSADAPPVFFFHGQEDRLVPLTSPRRLHTLLQHNGVPTQMHVVTGAGHLAAYMDRAAFEQAIQFLQRQLGAKSAQE
jgi:triacylglycerol lipase